jgi:hypothetical protein
MVGGASNAPVVTSDSCLRHRFYKPAAGTPPKIGSGGGSRAHRGGAYEARLNLILPAVEIGGVGG